MVRQRRQRECAFILCVFLGGAGCAFKVIPPKSQLVDEVVVRAGESPRIASADVEARIATEATSHFPVFEWLAGVPVAGVFDAVTVEYQVLDRFVLQRDLERVERYYRARGFVEVQVTAGRVITTAPGRVRVEIIVREGQPVLLVAAEPPTELLTRALERGAEREALLEASVAVGKLVADYGSTPIVELPRCSDTTNPACTPKPRFDEDRYDEVKRSIVRVLADGGFAHARVDGRATIDLERHEARVRFQVEPGPLCTFGDVTIVGNGEVPAAAVRARLGFKSGDRYSSVKLESAHDELAELGVFGSVDVRAEIGAADATPRSDVPITVSLQPVKLRTMKLGVGGLMGSQVEAHGIAGWEDRNILGGLRHLAVELRPGLVFFPARAETLFSQLPTAVVPQSALLAAFKQPSFLEQRTDLKVELSGRVYAPQIAPAPAPVPDGFNIVGYYELIAAVGLERRFRFPRLGARKDVRGRPTRTDSNRGGYAALDAQVAFGDARDVRLQPELRLYRPVAKRLVVALRWSVGLLFPFNYGDSLRAERLSACNDVVPAPTECSRDLQLLSFRAFYSGGPFSNRGYGFRQVGPHGQLQFATQRGQLTEFLPTGGMGSWELSAEVRIAVAQSLSWVLFLDSSDVVRTIDDFRLDYPHLAPGTGLRVATPVGALRLDVGFRPPYLQRLGHASLAVNEGGDVPGQSRVFPWAWALAIGEAF